MNGQAGEGGIGNRVAGRLGVPAVSSLAAATGWQLRRPVTCSRRAGVAASPFGTRHLRAREKGGGPGSSGAPRARP